MKQSDLLYIELLKYMVTHNNHFGFLDISPFLLDRFPEEVDSKERLKMGDFLEFLSHENYIELRDQHGIWNIQESGQKISREAISAIVKIKPKGVHIIEQMKLNAPLENFKKVGNILCIVLGVYTLIIGVYTLVILGFL